MGRQLIGLETVEDPVPIAPLAHQVGRLEDREVAGDRRSGDLEARRDGAGRQLTALQLLEDLTARGVGERPEDSRGVLHSFAI